MCWSYNETSQLYLSSLCVSRLHHQHLCSLKEGCGSQGATLRQNGIRTHSYMSFIRSITIASFFFPTHSELFWTRDPTRTYECVSHTRQHIYLLIHADKVLYLLSSLSIPLLTLFIPDTPRPLRNKTAFSALLSSTHSVFSS